VIRIPVDPGHFDVVTPVITPGNVVVVLRIVTGATYIHGSSERIWKATLRR
jgi:hypothetical protein